MVRKDEDSGRSEADVETDIRLAVLQLEPDWVDEVNSAGIGSTSRMEIAEKELRGI